MKRILFRYFNLFMAFVVLLSSTGFGLVEHSCQMRGKKKTMVVAFSDVKTQPGCAADRQPAPTARRVVKKTECCQDDQQYENVDVSSSLSQFVAKLVKAITESVLRVLLPWLPGLLTGFLPKKPYPFPFFLLPLLLPGAIF